jgi:hypothetical protein
MQGGQKTPLTDGLDEHRLPISPSGSFSPGTGALRTTAKSINSPEAVKVFVSRRGPENARSVDTSEGCELNVVSQENQGRGQLWPCPAKYNRHPRFNEVTNSHNAINCDYSVFSSEPLNPRRSCFEDMREANFSRPQVLAVIEELAPGARPRHTPPTRAGRKEVSPARQKTGRTNRLSEDPRPRVVSRIPSLRLIRVSDHRPD